MTALVIIAQMFKTTAHFTNTGYEAFKFGMSEDWTVILKTSSLEIHNMDAFAQLNTSGLRWDVQIWLGPDLTWILLKVVIEIKMT